MMYRRIFLSLLGSTLVFPSQTFAASSTQPDASPQRVLFLSLAAQCGRDVHPDTLQAVARVESQFNPYVIGVVNGRLRRQPESYAEAVATAKMLHAQGRNFSMGLMQVNRYNLAAYGLNYETVFHPCKNIQAGAAILTDCFKRAGGTSQVHLQKAFSCYYSGNFRTGFLADFKGQPSYVVKILNAARKNNRYQTLAYSVPAVNPSTAAAVSGAQPNKAVPVKAVLVSRQNLSQSSPRQPARAVIQYSEPQNSTAAAQPNAEPPKPRASWDVFGDF